MPRSRTTCTTVKTALSLLLCALILLTLATSSNAAIACFCATGGPTGGSGGGSGGGTPPNQAPVAAFTISPNPAIVSLRPTLPSIPPHPAPVDLGSDVVFDASGSTDDHGIATYEWDLGSGNFATPTTATTQTLRFYDTGTKTIRLRVTDAAGAASIVTHVLTIRHAPHAQIATDRATATVGQKVTYSAAGSTGDPGIASYAWDLDGNGTFETSSGTTPTVATTYRSPGKRTVAVRVTDTLATSIDASIGETINAAPSTATGASSGSGSGSGAGAGAGSGSGTPHALQRVTITSHTAKLSPTGVVAIRLSCPATESSCRGRLTLGALRASAAFHLGGGHAATVRVHLSRSVRSRIARRGTIRAAVTATTTDPAGARATARATVKLTR